MPDVRDRCFQDITAVNRQITAGKNVTLVTDKNNTHPCETAFGTVHWLSTGMAALSVTKVGVVNALPTREEADRLLEQQN